MFTRGEYQDTSGTYGVIVNREKTNIEVLLIESGSVISAFKHDDTGDYSFANVRAHDAERLISNGIRGCTSKNGNAIPFDLGTSIMHEFIRTKIEYIVELYNGELVGAEIKDEQKSKYLRLEYMKDQSFKIPAIPYVKLTAEKKKKKSADIDDMTVEDSVTVRSVSEIALEKEDVSWLKGKKYYIVNDDAQAEKLFKQLESYNGPIAYDTETTGLKINCFGKINSVYQRNLEKYNAEHPDDTIRADRMVGIIFCVEEDVSYYFPAFNRKFKNLYQDVDSPERIAAINNIKARYTVGDLAVQHDDDMYNYVTKTPAEEFRNDVVLMERVRNILEKGHIVGHNGTFDWKVGYQYGIDTNFKDDTMIMHQLMYKFRSTTSNRGESSALKYLEKREFGMDAWELEDFFPDFKEDNSGLTRGAKKKGSKIDFSYMDYDGTRVYAPTDGDATFKLFVKYKTDMMQNHKDMEYIYQVEMIVSSCIAYMEFYGHRLDERMINGARASTQAEVLCIESEIRDLVGYRSDKEKELYEKLSEQRAVYKDADASGDRDAINKAISEMEVTCKELRGVIDGDEEHPLNLAAPGQVATLFYDILKIPNPNTEGKKSVAKRELKALLKERNADGTPKYPVVHMYSEYKKQDTLVTKFFDNLQYFQYPGGYIFSSYGQIAAATGRMSCVDENTLVTTVGGYKKIKDIKVGDLVHCYDSNNNIDIKPVTRVIDQGYKDCIELTWKSSGKNMTGKLVCTPDHKILSKDYDWVRADKIDNDNGIYEIDRNHKSLINVHTGISSTKCGVHHVYDIEVEDNHNFIANEICVHNCSRPNAQQYPHSVTKMVKPRPGYLMADADYSQIEYRVLTALAGNEWLAELFSNPDSDYHTLMASLMYEVPYASVTGDMRKAAKSFNFGIPYGMGFASLAILLTGNSLPASVEEAKIKYEQYFKNQPKTRKFFDTVKEQAQVNKYTETFWHRRRYYSFEDKDGKTNNARKAAALRQAGNAVIQGCERGDTLIQTKEYGIVQVQDVVNQHLHVWNGEKWTNGDILYSGKKQKCIITFTNGQQFVCSPIHKFLVKSSKGNERFVECQDLLTKQNSKNPHRIVITRKYEPSDWKYSSDWAREKYTSKSLGAKNVFIDNIGDSFKAGVVLGRLASDGNIVNTSNNHVVRQIIAEHEMSVYDVLKEYMEPLGTTEYDVGIREGRTQDIIQLKAHSKSLASEVSELDIKNQIPKEVFQDTEMLRGFLRGLFDGDGGISGKTISLTFGTQADFEPMCRQIQKALLFFGVRSRYYKYDYRSKITIKTNDNQKFLDMIGFINPEKQEKGRSLECVKDEHVFGQILIPESVEITDEYIDMYDVCNTDEGYYVADGIITHNTAADVFKISVARNFKFIRDNHLLGKILIINMIHDEQLFEIDTRYLNIKKVITCIGKNMQFKIDGFPPLYIGAGVGASWDDAKGKDAEIHPTLLENWTKEMDSYGIWVKDPLPLTDDNMHFSYDFSTGNDDPNYRKSPDEWLKMLNDSNMQFRINKVKDYLLNPENKGKVIEPVIGNLLNLKFKYGHSKKEGLTDDQLTKKCLEEFIKHNGLEGICNPADYLTQEEDNALKNVANSSTSLADTEDTDEDAGYDDSDDENGFTDIDEEGEFSNTDFIPVDESDVAYGCTVQDLIQTFGNFVSKSRRICGIDMRNVSAVKADAIVDYLYEHVCDDDAPGAMEIMFLQDCNILKRTGIFVNNIDGSEVEKRLRNASAKYDFDERVQ